MASARKVSRPGGDTSGPAAAPSPHCADPARKLFLERVGRFFVAEPPGAIPPMPCQLCGETIRFGVVSKVDGVSFANCASQCSITAKRPGVTAPKPKLDADGKPLPPRLRKDGTPYGQRFSSSFARRTGAFVDASRAVVVGNVAPFLPLPNSVVHLTDGTNASFRAMYEAAFMEDIEPDALFVEFGLNQTAPMVLTTGRSVVMACGAGAPVPVDVATVRDVVGLMRAYGRSEVLDFVEVRARSGAEHLPDKLRRAAHDKFRRHLEEMPDAARRRWSLPTPLAPEMRYAKVICGEPETTTHDNEEGTPT